MLSVGALWEEIPAPQQTGHVLVTVVDFRGGKKDKANVKHGR